MRERDRRGEEMRERRGKEMREREGEEREGEINKFQLVRPMVSCESKFTTTILTE